MSAERLFREDRTVTTAGVARMDGRFFLARRKTGGAQSGRWEFPGGKCDQADRSEAACLAREFREEFAVDITVGDEIGSVPFEHGPTRYMLVAYDIRFVTPPTQYFEHSDAGWFSPSEMLALDLADSDRRLVETVLLGPDQGTR